MCLRNYYFLAILTQNLVTFIGLTIVHVGTPTPTISMQISDLHSGQAAIF